MNMKRILAILLSAILLLSLVFSFTACGPYSDAQANAILNELLTREADLNRYVYGDAFKTREDPGDDVDSPYQKYYKVAEDSKYLTLSSLMSEVDALIVSTSREEIYDYAFEGYEDENMSYPPRFAESADGVLEINVADHMYSPRTVALLGSAKVKRANETHIKANITVYRFDSEGNPIKATKTVDIRIENGEWKLVSQTMIVGVTETPY